MKQRGVELAADVTSLLRAWSAGEDGALERLTPVLYDELKRLARRHMRRERNDHTLQATALVNEAFLRLVDVRGVEWQDRAHFFALSAQMMRRILVNYAVANRAGKRGGDQQKIPLDDVVIAEGQREPQLLALDEALRKLAEFDPRKAKVVELRFFGGLTVEETATVLRLSPQSVLRDWSLAKSWLARELETGS